MKEFISVKNLVKTYKVGTKNFNALDGIRFDIKKGEFVCILGPSGAGKSTLLNLLGGMDTATSGSIVVDNENIEKYDKNELTTYRAENVELIQDKVALEKGMSNMLNTMKTMIILIIGIAVVLGSVIIYNLGILSYTEKQYQFSTLKVLGFSDKKNKKIFIMQNNWIAVMSIILGLPFGYALVDWLFKEAIEEHYDFQAHIEPLTYIIAAIGTFIVSYLVSKLLSKKVNNIDMVSSLKGNE